MEGFEMQEANPNDVEMLAKHITENGIDTNDHDAVVGAAQELFSQGYPEADVEAIISKFLQQQ